MIVWLLVSIWPTGVPITIKTFETPEAACREAYREDQYIYKAEVDARGRILWTKPMKCVVVEAEEPSNG